jgi:hypothetical protein
MGDIHGFQEGTTPCRYFSAGTGRARMMSRHKIMLYFCLCGAKALFNCRGSQALEALIARILKDGFC